MHLIFVEEVHALESRNYGRKKACVTQLVLRIAEEVFELLGFGFSFIEALFKSLNLLLHLGFIDVIHLPELFEQF